MKLSDEKFLKNIDFSKYISCLYIKCRKCKNFNILKKIKTEEEYVECFNNYIEKIKLNKMKEILKR
jgi:hypothetical protein